MQSNFDRSLSAVLKHEGGWADHPKDPGGATMKGVTLATFRRLVKPGATKADLKAITSEQVATVYRKGFWSKIMADDLPAGIDFALFDYAVNSGPARAVKALQKLVGATADGVVGPKTLAAVAGHDDPAGLINALCDQRQAFVERLKTFSTFGKGWTSRIKAVRKLALEMARQQPSAPVDEPTHPHSETPASEAPTGFQISWPKVAMWVAALAGLVLIARNLFT